MYDVLEVCLPWCFLFKIYWVDGKKGILGSMNMDGTDFTTFPIEDRTRVFSIAISSVSHSS